MDRCRCEEYEDAVKKLRFYTVGTLRPEAIDNYNRKGIIVAWLSKGISRDDMTFKKPRARKILQWHEYPENRVSHEARKIEQMWCPFMSPYKAMSPEEEEIYQK